MAYNQFRTDYSSEQGARSLAEKVVEYWRMRGHEVRVEVVCDRDPGDPYAMWHVRTNLIAGRPQDARQRA